MKRVNWSLKSLFSRRTPVRRRMPRSGIGTIESLEQRRLLSAANGLDGADARAVRKEAVEIGHMETGSAQQQSQERTAAIALHRALSQ